MVTRLATPAIARRPLLSLLAAGLVAGTSRGARAADTQVQRAELAPALYEIAYSAGQNGGAGRDCLAAQGLWRHVG
jgi:hypothetical protein